MYTQFSDCKHLLACVSSKWSFFTLFQSYESEPQNSKDHLGFSKWCGNNNYCYWF